MTNDEIIKAIQKEANKKLKRNEEMMKSKVPPIYEYDENKGFIDGCLFCLSLLEGRDESKA